MKQQNQKIIIGIFDSGTGGLPVMKRVQHYIQLAGLQASVSTKYLGDTKNFPYGTKTFEELKHIVRENIKTLFQEGATILGIACNTASIVYNNDELSHIHPHILPIVNLSASLAAEVSTNHVHVISSDFTAASHAYKELIEKEKANVIVTESGQQEFIKAIENSNQKAIEEHIKQITTSLPQTVDTLVLGCTHFSRIHEKLRQQLEKLGRHITIIDPTDAMAKELIITAEMLLEKITISHGEDISFSGFVPEYDYL